MVRLTRPLLVLLPLLFVGLSCGDDEPEASAIYDATGRWEGQFASQAAGREISGSIRVEIVQENGVFTGQASMTNAPCVSSVNVIGTINEEFIFHLDVIDPNDPAKEWTIDGAIFPDTNAMEATYEVINWGVCTGSFGTISAERVSN